MTHPDLQQLYSHLDGIGGTTRIAWYGQLRAEGQSHLDALKSTVLHYRLTDTDWYKVRIKNGLKILD